ncbi:MAG: ABC transporter ATP-binding protein [Chloroflexota bacterium]|nr:ABC transporter ATP-binding protein [Chloroflexota bacterium]
MSVLLQVKGLTVHFHTKRGMVRAVDGISYDLAEGEILCMVGESGSGKSTSILSLMKLLSKSKHDIIDGEVVFEGRELLRLSESEMRHVRGSRIAMVFQEPNTSLNPMLSVGRQISETLQHNLGMDRKAAIHRSAELLQMVGVADAKKRLGDYPHQFSGGMLQRVMIAMALSCGPRLLLADEPTSALDVTTQAQVLETIKSSADSGEMAVILVTHNLGLAAQYCQRVIVMYAGHIVEEAPVLEFFNRPQHPYSQALIRAVPRLDQPVEERLCSIEGFPPNLVAPPGGCLFHPRCDYAIEVCSTVVPSLTYVSESHRVACWVCSKGS